jgi:ATP-binding cassette subfamily B protein
MDYEYHVKANTGDLIQRCTSDVETIRSFLATQAVEIGRGVFLVAMTASLMSSLNGPLTWISMSVLPAIFGFGYVFFLRVKHVFGESDESEGRMSASLQENITGIRVVRAFARKDHEMAKFDEKNRDFRDKTYRLIRLLAWYWSISDLLCFTQIGLVMSVGGLWAAQGRLSLGTAVVFFTYVGRLLWPVRQMGRILTEMGKSTVALRRIQEVLDTPPEMETGDSAVM